MNSIGEHTCSVTQLAPFGVELHFETEDLICLGEEIIHEYRKELFDMLEELEVIIIPDSPDTKRNDIEIEQIHHYPGDSAESMFHTDRDTNGVFAYDFLHMLTTDRHGRNIPTWYARQSAVASRYRKLAKEYKDFFDGLVGGEPMVLDVDVPDFELLYKVYEHQAALMEQGKGRRKKATRPTHAINAGLALSDAVVQDLRLSGELFEVDWQVRKKALVITRGFAHPREEREIIVHRAGKLDPRQGKVIGAVRRGFQRVNKPKDRVVYGL